MLRISKDSDKTQIKNLYKRIFVGEDDFSDRFFDILWKSDDCFLSDIDGEIVSAVNLIPKRLVHSGNTFTAGYIYAAMTDEQHRGTGEMSRLLEFSFEQGFDFSILIVQNESLFDFYSRFGYKAVCSVCEKSVSPRIYDGIEISVAKYEDYATLLGIYNQEVQSALAVERCEAEFDVVSRLYNLPFYIAKSGGDITAYCIGEVVDNQFFAIEAMGADACKLVSTLAMKNRCESGIYRTVGTNKTIGMIKPISCSAEKVLKNCNDTYINLLYN